MKRIEVFQSDDGLTFATEWECEAHERRENMPAKILAHTWHLRDILFENKSQIVNLFTLVMNARGNNTYGDYEWLKLRDITQQLLGAQKDLESFLSGKTRPE